MAVFGVPMVHEDDALRAVRAADELRDSLVSLNDELERNYGVSLQLRTGVNTGEVVAGTEERLVTGDAVNVAARLEQAAQPGEIRYWRADAAARAWRDRGRAGRAADAQGKGGASSGPGVRRSLPTGCCGSSKVRLPSSGGSMLPSLDAERSSPRVRAAFD
jgi:class 3 adenylate cyclase